MHGVKAGRARGGIFGNADLIVFSFFRARPEYAYLWIIEYDVHYEGKWSYFFERFESSNADLLGTSMGCLATLPRAVQHMNPPLKDEHGVQPALKETIAGIVSDPPPKP